MPSGANILALFRLAAEEGLLQETLCDFGFDIAQSESRIRSRPQSEVPKEEEEARPGAMRKDGRIQPKYYKPGRKP